MSTQATIPQEHRNVGRQIFDVKNGRLLEDLRADLLAFRKGEYMPVGRRQRIVRVVLEKIEELQTQTPKPNT